MINYSKHVIRKIKGESSNDSEAKPTITLSSKYVSKSLRHCISRPPPTCLLLAKYLFIHLHASPEQTAYDNEKDHEEESAGEGSRVPVFPFTRLQQSPSDEGDDQDENDGIADYTDQSWHLGNKSTEMLCLNLTVTNIHTQL